MGKEKLLTLMLAARGSLLERHLGGGGGKNGVVKRKEQDVA